MANTSRWIRVVVAILALSLSLAGASPGALAQSDPRVVWYQYPPIAGGTTTPGGVIPYGVEVTNTTERPQSFAVIVTASAGSTILVHPAMTSRYICEPFGDGTACHLRGLFDPFDRELFMFSQVVDANPSPEVCAQPVSVHIKVEFYSGYEENYYPSVPISCPLPPPTATVVPSPTPLPTATVTPSPTPLPTATVTPSPTPSTAPSPTATAAPSPDPTGEVAPSPTPAITATTAPTVTPGVTTKLPETGSGSDSSAMVFAIGGITLGSLILIALGLRKRIS